MATAPSTAKFKVEIDGTPLPDEIDHLLTSVIVDNSLNQPDLFALSFRDTERTVIKQSKAKIGSALRVKVFSDAAPSGEPLVSGEITALEIDHDGHGTRTVIRGFDHSHRLFRGRCSQTYLNMTYSDVVQRVAQRNGLKTGTIDPTKPVHDQVSQGNLNDWQFLQGLAKEVGYEVTVADSKLDFRKPKSADDGPAAGDLNSEGAPTQLTMGKDIVRVHAVVTAAEQVNKVEVRGWDPAQKKAIVGTAEAKTAVATLPKTKPTDLATAFGGKTLVGVNVPYHKQAEVDAAAKAAADHIAGSFAEIEAVVRGNPKLKAGKAVNFSLLGEAFDGKYVPTSVRHQYSTHDGYTTAITVSGKNQRSLLGLTAGAANGTSGGLNGGAPPLTGVVVGLVTDIKDPNHEGRIKLKFPWLSDTYTSDWARAAQAGAGNGRGAVFLPEVNDEVLVAFEQGDIRRPYVIGGLHNGVDKPKHGDRLVDDSSGAVTRRGVVSKHGHALVLFDDAGKDGLALLTGDRNLRISLNKTKTEIKISSKGKVTISGDGDVSVKAGGNLNVEATSSLTLKGQSIKVQAAGGDVSVTGTTIKLN